MLIEWRDEFSIGIPDVDSEHKELIQLINETHAQIVAGSDDRTIADFLGEIYAAISSHFALEEKLMRERNYDQSAAHKEDHERLLDEIRDIMDDFEHGAFVTDENLNRHLEAWFVQHFKNHDSRLHKHLH